MKSLFDRRVAARPGQAYALYFTRGGSVRLDLREATGPFKARWIDVATGDWGRSDTIEGGSPRTLTAPTPGHWVVALVR